MGRNGGGGGGGVGKRPKRYRGTYGSAEPKERTLR